MKSSEAKLTFGEYLTKELKRQNTSFRNTEEASEFFNEICSIGDSYYEMKAEEAARRAAEYVTNYVSDDSPIDFGKTDKEVINEAVQHAISEGA